jgi:hypothetical protein
MTDETLPTDSISEIYKLIQLMDEDAPNLKLGQIIGDYISPILISLVAEVDANRQHTLQTEASVRLAMLMTEKTFLGDILGGIAEHFTTMLEELPENIQEDSKLGVAVGEIHELLATWMAFEPASLDIQFEEDEEDEEGEEGEEDDEETEEDEESDTVVEVAEVAEVLTDG